MDADIKHIVSGREIFSEEPKPMTIATDKNLSAEEKVRKLTRLQEAGHVDDDELKLALEAAKTDLAT
ncbi:MAG: hypothetical protein AAGG69_00355 [Pseudomonadota bacterium]